LVQEIPHTDVFRLPTDNDLLGIRILSAIKLRNKLTSLRAEQHAQINQGNELHLLGDIVEQSANAIAVFDNYCNLQWINNSFRKIYGLEDQTNETLMGTPIEKILQFPGVLSLIVEMPHNSRSAEFVSHIRTRTFEYKWLKNTLSPIRNTDGHRAHWAVIGTDITSQKNAEDELTIQRDDIIAMTESLKKVIHETQQKNVEINQRSHQIEVERDAAEEGIKRTEQLLMSVLPFEAAIQLKSKGSAQPRNYKLATIMFTDFKGFTKACQDLSPQEVVNSVHAYFAVFDDITENRNIEKIKTIGDAYMCAGGIPLRNKSNPIDVVLSGLEIQHFMAHLDLVAGFETVPRWSLRLGIHTGPIVAGVVGKRKIAYDIWGDTVNVASRMETAGEVGRVNISRDTYNLVKDYFECEYRGEIDTKNHGKIGMYFVNRLRPEFTDDIYGVKPNERFLHFLHSL
jgi:PAS domain S-box-containing protein